MQFIRAPQSLGGGIHIIQGGRDTEDDESDEDDLLFTGAYQQKYLPTPPGKSFFYFILLNHNSLNSLLQVQRQNSVDLDPVHPPSLQACCEKLMEQACHAVLLLRQSG